MSAGSVMSVKPGFARRLALLSVLIGAPTLIVAAGVVAGSPSDAQRVTLSGHIQPLAQPRFDAGAVPGNLSMVDLKLVLRNSPAQEAALEKFLAAQQTQGSPQYHRWLTPAQFGSRFGARAQDIEAASVWLQAHGFKVGAVPAGRGLLPFSGTADEVQAAFQTPIHYFIVDGVRHFANTANPEIPAALQSLVSGVRGLHDFRPKSGARKRVVAVPRAGIGGNNFVGPADYAVIYDFVPLYKGNINGSGVTVAVAAQSDIDPAIPANYWSAFGVDQSQQLTSVAAAAATDPGRTGDGNETEAYLDVEIAGALAPGAKIVLVRDKSSLNAADYAINHNLAAVLNISFSDCESALGGANASINASFKQAAAQGITVVVSTGDSGVAECDDAIEAKQGSTVLTGLSVSGIASTPYNLAVGGTDLNPVLVQSGDYWNDTNNVGTSANARSYIPEMVWNESCVNPVTAQINGEPSQQASCNDAAFAVLDLISGTGGGVSSCTSVRAGTCTGGYAQPSWQKGIAGLQGVTTRAIPDVAMLASDWITCDQGNSTCGPGGTINIIGGTSAAAPGMAAIVALLDQSLISKSNADGRQGNIDPMLYKLAATEYGTAQSLNSAGLASCNADNGANVGATCVFNDVTTGSNGQPCNVGKFASGKGFPASSCTSQAGDTYGIVTASSTVVYNAGAAYDLASGLGSINAANLVQTIAGLTSPSALNATANGTAVALTWNPGPGALSYDVYQGTASGAEAAIPVQTGITATSSTVTGLAPGQTYYFLVSAVTASGLSLPSDEANVTLVPSAPTGLAAAGNASTVTLTWSPSPGASSYSVLEGTMAGGEAAAPIADSLTATTYSLPGMAGTTDYFQVIAVNDGGNSASSNEVAGTVLPAAPSGLTATGGSAAVSLSWSAGQGATSYDILQGDSSGNETIAVSHVTGTTTTVSGLANSTKYYFEVAGVNASGNSAPSNEASATTATPSHGGGSPSPWQLLAVGLLLMLRTVRRGPADKRPFGQ